MRKTTLLTLVVLLGVLPTAGCGTGVMTTTPFALSPSMPWSDIRDAPNIVVQAPQVQFGTNFVSVMSLCRSGGTVRAQPGVGVTGEVPVASTPQHYNIVVAQIEGNGEHSYAVPLFSKPYDIPACG